MRAETWTGLRMRLVGPFRAELVPHPPRGAAMWTGTRASSGMRLPWPIQRGVEFSPAAGPISLVHDFEKICSVFCGCGGVRVRWALAPLAQNGSKPHFPSRNYAAARFSHSFRPHSGRTLPCFDRAARCRIPTTVKNAATFADFLRGERVGPNGIGKAVPNMGGTHSRVPPILFAGSGWDIGRRPPPVSRGGS